MLTRSEAQLVPIGMPIDCLYIDLLNCRKQLSMWNTIWSIISSLVKLPYFCCLSENVVDLWLMLMYLLFLNSKMDEINVVMVSFSLSCGILVYSVLKSNVFMNMSSVSLLLLVLLLLWWILFWIICSITSLLSSII